MQRAAANIDFDQKSHLKEKEVNRLRIRVQVRAVRDNFAPSLAKAGTAASSRALLLSLEKARLVNIQTG